MEDTPKSSENKSNKGGEKPHWMGEVARQSWEPELLISGAAAFASLSLPNLIASGYAAYASNLMTGTGTIDRMFPLLIFGVFASAAQILIVTLITHFTMRAFWIGFIGLLSVYPKGIQYKKIQFLNDYGRQYLKQRMTTVNEFALRLDKWCSILFSLAFVIILFMAGIAFGYLLFFLLIFVGKTLLTADQMRVYEIFLMGLVIVFFLTLAVITLLTKYAKNKGKDSSIYEKWYFIINYQFFRIIFPFINKAMTYLLYTFYSNLPRQKILNNIAIVSVLFMFLLYFQMIKLTKREGVVFETRNYYSQGSDENCLQADFYENLRDKSQPVQDLTIQSDIIKKPMLKLFIAYPKRLDALLKKICPKLLKIPEKTSSYMRNKLMDEQRLACFNKLYEVYVNGKRIKKTDFMYHTQTNNDTKGVIAYVLVAPKAGKNLLEIKTSVLNTLIRKQRRKPYLYKLPFWYLPAK